MEYNIVTSQNINQIFKQQSKFYKIDLGQAITLESRSGDRELNLNDKFAFSYNSYYKTGLLRQGNIGDIRFYTDHQMPPNIIRFYIDLEEFIYDVDLRKLETLGIDGYLGELLKNSKEQYETLTKVEDKEEVIVDQEKVIEKITQNPGKVTYEDLKAHIENLKRLQKS